MLFGQFPERVNEYAARTTAMLVVALALDHRERRIHAVLLRLREEPLGELVGNLLVEPAVQQPDPEAGQLLLGLGLGLDSGGNLVREKTARQG